VLLHRFKEHKLAVTSACALVVVASVLLGVYRKTQHTGPINSIAVLPLDIESNRTNGEILANATKAKIRNIFSVIFNHAIRYEWLEQGKNPVTLVRQSATRRSDPQVLDYGEIQALLGQLRGSAIDGYARRYHRAAQERTFCSEWRDIDFGRMMVSVQRSFISE
jgi:hypothetical protein